MIEIKEKLKQEEYPIELFNPQGESLGTIYSIKQLLDVQLQIKEQSLSGYYIKWKENEYFIDKSGRIINKPDDMFSTLDYLAKLLVP